MSETCQAAKRMFRIANGFSTCTRSVSCAEAFGRRMPSAQSLSLETSRQCYPDGSQHVMHMQKSLDQMNLQLHHVLSDITGLSGQCILDAILAGERDPMKLAELCHARVRSSQDKIAKALEGDYRAEHLFTLKQSLAGYRYYQQQIQEVDREIQRQMMVLPIAQNAQPELPKRTKKHPYGTRHNEPTSFSLRSELYRVFGVDLTNVPGISAVTAQTILCEVGTDLSRFRNASAFASWLARPVSGKTNQRREGAVYAHAPGT